MTTFHAVVAVVALFMLLRHAPRAVRLLRGGGAPFGVVLELVNVVLALVVLVFALKGLAGEAAR